MEEEEKRRRLGQRRAGEKRSRSIEIWFGYIHTHRLLIAARCEVDSAGVVVIVGLASE
jgi:hypothetical protein